MVKDDSESISSSQTGPTLARITYSGDSDEYVIIGNQKYYRHELMLAFGGTLNPGIRPYPKNDYNSAPLGLAALSTTTFVFSLFNSRAMGITIPTLFISLACFYGGLVQFLAGAWLLVAGNTFAATALTSYGAFYLSYGAIYIESFGISSAYAETDQLHNAIGFLFLGWTVFTFMLGLATMKSTVAFFTLFVLLFLTFLLLAVSQFTESIALSQASGVVGVITSIVGWYNAYAGIATRQNSYIMAKAIPIPRFI